MSRYKKAPKGKDQSCSDQGVRFAAPQLGALGDQRPSQGFIAAYPVLNPEPAQPPQCTGQRHEESLRAGPKVCVVGLVIGDAENPLC